MADEHGSPYPNGPDRSRSRRGRHRAEPESQQDNQQDSDRGAELPPADPEPRDPDHPTVALPALGRSEERLAAARAAENATVPPHRRRWPRILAWTAGSLVVLLIAVGVFGYLVYRHYDGRIHRADVLATNDPNIKDKTKQEHAQNFLLIGSDTRSGANGRYENSAGQVAGARSDTTILAHLSPGGGKATMVSFPRDSWVHVPSCRKPDGTMSKPYDGMFNSAFELGGAACTIRLVQALTGVEVTHYVQIDFTGFKTMVNALGGVPVCTPVAINEPESGLKLHAGTQKISGDQALAYVRARYNIGDGSDLGRIKRQQQFLGAMLRVATSDKILFNPGKLKSFMDAATKSVTLDKQTHLTDLYGLAQQLRHLDAAHANFLTVPIADPNYTPPGTNETGRVKLDLAAAKPLWQSIIDDNGTVKVPVSGANSPSPKHSSKPKAKKSSNALTVAPQDVTVKIVNGVGTPYLATHAKSDLIKAGFNVSTLTLQPSGATAAVIQYAPGELAAARTLAAAVPGSTLQADAAAPTDAVVLIVGSSYSGAHAVSVGQQANPPHRSGDSTNGPSPSPSGSTPPSISAAQHSCSL